MLKSSDQKSTLIIILLVILIGAVLFSAGMYLGNIKSSKTTPTIQKTPTSTPTAIPTIIEEPVYQAPQTNSDIPANEVPYGDENFDTDQQYQDAMQ